MFVVILSHADIPNANHTSTFAVLTLAFLGIVGNIDVSSMPLSFSVQGQIIRLVCVISILLTLDYAGFCFCALFEMSTAKVYFFLVYSLVSLYKTAYR